MRGTTLRKALAVDYYLVGAAFVLYVAVLLPYAQRERPRTVLFLDNWYLFVVGMALVATAPFFWPRRRDDDDNGLPEDAS